MKKINGIDIPEKTVYDFMHERNQGNLDIPALEYCSNQFTYQEFFDEVETYARSFLQMGIKKGDVVTLCMPGVVEFVVAYYALNHIGAIANGVSINFLRSNIKRYTDEKKSDTLIIFDKFYNQVCDSIPFTKLKNIIITSLYDYMPERMSKDNGYDLGRSNLNKKQELILMKDFILSGQRDTRIIKPEKYDCSSDSTYLYTSGTTGDPKCVVFKDDSINALVCMHDSIDLNEKIGDRSLLIIPPYYATSLLYAINLQLSKGKTLVFQPIYNKNTFARDLSDLKINDTVAAMSHYTTLINSNLSEGSLSLLKHPFSGGEGGPYYQVKKINEKLKFLGSVPLILGGGTSELGSGIMANYFDPNRVNETGHLFPGVEVKIVDPITRETLPQGHRGEMIVCSPNAMDRYYDNPMATSEYFKYEDGKRWGFPRDIAIQNENGTYTMLGRKDDSYINDNDEVVYLFDIEEIVSADPAVLECEASALAVNHGAHKALVVHLVLNKDCDESLTNIIKRISKLANIEGIKIVDSFGTSEITGKRDYKVLATDREDFYAMFNDELYITSFPYEPIPLRNKNKIKKISK